jgi:hypothetical protein
MTHDNGDQTIGRRRLLRRAGTVAAGVAGAGVVSAVAATPAQAASGSFDSASATTPAVKVSNTSLDANGGAGPQLAFTPTGSFIDPQAPVGSVSMDTDGFIWVRDAGIGADAATNFVHTTANSNLTVAIAPVRALDTGTAPGRARVLNQENINAAGQLMAKKWIHLDLSGSELVNYGFAVLGGIIAVTPSLAGYLTVVPYGSVNYGVAPITSNLNYVKGVSITNSVFVGLGGDLDLDTPLPTDVISIYSLVATRVIFDVSGFVVDSYGRVPALSTLAQGARKGVSFAEKRRQDIAKVTPKP